MTSESALLATLTEIEASGPVSYAMALHIKFTSPTVLLQTYPKEWTDYYSQNGLVMSDPTVAWGFENVGTQRWSDLATQDPAGVMAAAATHGLTYGVVCVVETDGSRSLCSFARADREFDDDEITGLAQQVTKLHDLTVGHERFSTATAQTLKTMDVRLTESVDE